MKPISFKEAQDVEFVKAHICGADGLIPSVHLDESTLPKKVFPYYIKIDGEKAIIEMPEVAEDKENSYMFITYRDDLLPDGSKSLRYPKWLFQISTRKVKWRGVTASLRRSRRIYEYWESGEYLIKEKPPEPDFKIASIEVNGGIIDVLFANRIIVGDFYDKDAYKYYICASGTNGVVRPDMLMEKYNENSSIFGTILSPVPIFMREESVELMSITISDIGMDVDDALLWIRRSIFDYDIHEQTIIDIIHEVANEKLNSYEIAKAIKSRIGCGVIGKIGDDYVWTNIVTGRSYDRKGRREGCVEYDLINE